MGIFLFAPIRVIRGEDFSSLALRRHSSNYLTLPALPGW